MLSTARSFTNALAVLPTAPNTPVNIPVASTLLKLDVVLVAVDASTLPVKIAEFVAVPPVSNIF
jgi:hypothetical protein